MPIFFLTPKLLDPNIQRASGGSISNLRMVEALSEHDQIVCIPMICSHVPPSLEKSPFITLELPKSISHGRLRYVIERYVQYMQRVENAIIRHGKGLLISTRATIPAAHRMSKKFGIPFVILTRAFEDMEQAGLRNPADKQTVFRRLEGSLNNNHLIAAYCDAALIITNSEYMKKEICRLFKTTSPIHVVYPTMDLPQTEPNACGLKKVGFVNKGKRKGEGLILELAHKLPDINFLIYGDPLRANKKKHGQNIENVGYENNREEMFGKVDAFLVPSVWDEPFGRVAAEAIWAGKPVIVSKKGGLPEAAPNELFWEESGDPSRWRDKILMLANLEKKEINKAIASAQCRLAGYEKITYSSLFQSLGYFE